MQKITKCAVASAVALAVSSSLHAGTAPYFIPLTSSQLIDYPDGNKVCNDGINCVSQTILSERTGPYKLPLGATQSNVLNMEDVENTVGESIVRVDNGQNSSMFDMLAYDPTGDYIFIPHETTQGAGLSRHKVSTGVTEVLFKGDETRNYVSGDDYGAFDPARWTPNETVIVAEEWAGTGRMVEVCNPLGAAPTDPNAPALTEGDCQVAGNDYSILEQMPLVSQEGIQFSEVPAKFNDIIYFVDEDRSGSIYKTDLKTPGDYEAGGATYVLSVDTFISSGGEPEKRWDRDGNVTADRTGACTWVQITDENGDPLPGIQDPRVPALNGGTGDAGLVAADDVNGTPYGRPEDTTTTTLANGNEAIMFAATSENAIYTIEELTPVNSSNGGTCNIFVMAKGANSVDATATPNNVGFPSTSAVMNAPDNLAIDSLGNIYAIEDGPNNGPGSSIPSDSNAQVGSGGGDVWFLRDTDNDGVAESIDHFISMGVSGAESTGMIFNPVDPTKFIIAVQHPRSTVISDWDNDLTTDDDLGSQYESSSPSGDGERSSDGFGDAIWEIDLTQIAPPECVGPRSAWMTFNPATNRWVRACSSQRDYNADEQLVESEDPNDFPTP